MILFSTLAKQFPGCFLLKNVSHGSDGYSSCHWQMFVMSLMDVSHVTDGCSATSPMDVCQCHLRMFVMSAYLITRSLDCWLYPSTFYTYIWEYLSRTCILNIGLLIQNSLNSYLTYLIFIYLLHFHIFSSYNVFNSLKLTFTLFC